MIEERNMTLPWEWDLSGLPVSVQYYYYPADTTVGTNVNVEIVHIFMEAGHYFNKQKISQIDMLPALSNKMVEHIRDELIEIERTKQ